GLPTRTGSKRGHYHTARNHTPRLVLLHLHLIIHTSNRVTSIPVLRSLKRGTTPRQWIIRRPYTRWQSKHLKLSHWKNFHPSKSCYSPFRRCNSTWMKTTFILYSSE